VQDLRKSFHRDGPDVRRRALIEATLALISERGIEAASVRAIAARADVTQGLIRHYFSSKEELIAAAYAHHMAGLTEHSFTKDALDETGSAGARLRALVIASLTAPVVDPGALALWAGFMSRVQRDPEMRRIHAEAYTEFQNRCALLIEAALRDVGRDPTLDQIKRLTFAVNALLDGLWLEAGALPEVFENEDLPQLGLEAVGAVLRLDLITAE